MSAAVPDFSRLKVAVIGDLVADRYLNAEPRRLSREAPVMVLRHISEHTGAGGAANLACNLRALDCQVSVFGQVGADRAGRSLMRLLEDDGLDTAGVGLDPSWTTPTKMRILAAEPRRSPQQILRIDHEPKEPLAPASRAKIAALLGERQGEFDCLLLSDYGYGLVQDEVARVARAACAAGCVVVLDPRQGPERFLNLTALTPNLGELAQFSGLAPERLDDPEHLRQAAQDLLGRTAARYLLVTRGNQGMALFGEDLGDEGVAVEASGQGEVTCVSGAGDTAAAVFGLGLAAHLPAPQAMRLANTASGVVVMENGAAVCTPGQLAAALPGSPAPTRLAGFRL
jgi:rfaE bifunctional protein kinase chain/domain